MPNRDQLREAAINALVEDEKRERAGAASQYSTKVQPAINAALAAGCGGNDIYAEADRRYGRWLIDNAGR